MIIGNPWLHRNRKTAAMMTFKKWKNLTVGSGKSPGPGGIPVPRVVAQRAAMSQIVELGRSIAASIYVGFKEYNATIGQWAAWIKFNVTPAFIFSGPTATLVPENVTPAKGSLLDTPMLTAVADASSTPNQIACTWDNTTNFGQSENDQWQQLVYNITKDEWRVGEDSGTKIRYEGSGTVLVNGFLTVGDELLVFTWFTGAAGEVSAGKNSDALISEVTVVA